MAPPAPRIADVATPAPVATATPPPRDESVVSLPYRPTAEGYSEVLDQLLVASANPNALHVIHPGTGLDLLVALPSAPLGLSLSPDGRKAAIGHRQSISIVSLDPPSLLEVVRVPVISEPGAPAPPPDDIRELIYDGDNRIFLLDARNRLQILSVSSASYVNQGIVYGYYAIARRPGSARLALSGNTDLGFVEAREVPLLYRRDWTQGLMSLSTRRGSKLWWAADGRRLFLSAGRSVEVPEDFSLPSKEVAGLDGLPRVGALWDSGARGVLLAIPPYPEATHAVPEGLLPSTELAIFDSATLARRAVVSLPRGEIDGVPFVSHGRFVAVRPDGMRAYVLVDLDKGPGASRPTGLVTLDLTDPAKPVVVTRPPSPIPSDRRRYRWTESQPATSLDFGVVAAVYSRALDRIVVATEAPPEVRILSPSLTVERRIPLTREPTALALDPRGDTLTIGQDGAVSRLTLTSGDGRVEEFPLPRKVVNVADPGTGWIFATDPSGGNHGIEVRGSRRFEPWGTNGSSMRARAGTGSVYQGISTRFDSSAGALPERVSVMSVGNSSENFWISEDGAYSVTERGRTFLLSQDPASDLEPSRKLIAEGDGRIAAFAESRSLRRALVLLDRSGALQIATYDAEGMLPLGGIYLSSQGSTKALFVDNAGKRAFAVLGSSDSASVHVLDAEEGAGSPSETASATRPAPPAPRAATAAPSIASGAVLRPLSLDLLDSFYSEKTGRLLLVSRNPLILHEYVAGTGIVSSRLLDVPGEPVCAALDPEGRTLAIGTKSALALVPVEKASPPVIGFRGPIVAVSLDADWCVYSTGHPDKSSLRALDRKLGVDRAVTEPHGGNCGAAPHWIRRESGIAYGAFATEGFLRLGRGSNPHACSPGPGQESNGFSIVATSRDGHRAYLGNGRAYRADLETIRYETSLRDGKRLRHVLDDDRMAVVVGVPDVAEGELAKVRLLTPGNQLLFYRRDSLGAVGRTQLPDFPQASGRPRPAMGRKVFADANGTRLLVVVADTSVTFNGITLDSPAMAGPKARIGVVELPVPVFDPPR